MKKHVVVAYGRFQPPQAGHHMLVQKLIQHAKDVDADHFVFGSHSEGSEDNPLSPEVKKQHMKKVLATNNVIVNPELKGITDVLQHLHDRGYEKITLFAAGEDRIPGYEKLRPYFGKKNVNKTTGKVLDLTKISPENYKVHSAGERDPDAEGIEGISGTKMREAAISGDLDKFHSMLPSHVERQHAGRMMQDVQSGIQAVRAAKEAKKAARKKKKTDEDINPIVGSFLNEFVSASTRQKLARVARRTAKRRAMLNRMRKMKRRTNPQLKIRARNEVQTELRRRVYKGNWKKLSYAQRANIDKAIGKRRPLINSMFKKIMPQVIRGESERLRNLNAKKRTLNSSFDPVIDNFFSNFLSEAKTPKRPTPSTEQKQRRRNQNRENQRTHRSREDASVDSGNIAGKVMVVKNKATGDTEIIEKDSYDANNHEKIVGAEKATVGSVQRYLKDKAFVNTKTSVRLFGLQQDAGKSKTKSEAPTKAEKKTKAKAKETKKAKPAKSEKAEPLPLPEMGIDPNWTMPKNKNQRGFKASDMEASVATNLALMLNGSKPEELIKDGIISPEEYNLILSNPNLQQATLRAIKAAGLDRLEPKRYKFYATGKMRQQISESFAGMGTTDNTLKSDIFIYDTKEPEKGSRNISVKYGASQFGSPKEKEATAVVKTAFERAKEMMSPKCKKASSGFIGETLKQMSQGIKVPGTFGVLTKDIGGYGTANPKLRKAAEDAKKRNKQIQEGFNKLVDDCPELKREIIRELATGAGKFEGTFSQDIFEKFGKKVNVGTANEMLSISEDGTMASLNAIDDDFLDKVMPDVKFYFAMKTTDCGDSATLKVYDREFKPALISAAQKGSKKEFEKLVKFAQKQFKMKGVVAPSFKDKDITDMMKSTAENGSVPNVLKFKTHCSKSAFRAGKKGEKEEVEEGIVFSFIKNYITEASTETSIVQTHKGQIKDEDLEPLENPDPEDTDPDAWLDYSQEVIGDDPLNFLSFMGLDFQSISMEPIDIAEIFARLQSSRSNVVYVNGMGHDIPVMDSQMNEGRNYRKEYDNYHARPEQRKNRSKRVLARRLMMKLGRVRKGDGKDVDHKDGNPKNNGKGNLRVRDKSENRADN